MIHTLLTDIQGKITQQWAFVALIITIIVLWFRYAYLHDQFETMRNWGKDIYKKMLSAYFKNCLPGWFFLFSGIACAVWAACFPKYWIDFLSRREGMVFAFIFILCGTLFHARVLHISSLNVLKSQTEQTPGF